MTLLSSGYQVSRVSRNIDSRDILNRMNHDNILLIDKPAGWTSFDVVAKIRGRIRFEYKQSGIAPTKKQLRVGHAGTLDPFATGLLIVLLGDSCKRAGEFLKLDKIYEATVELGKTSTTGDPEGEIIKWGKAQESAELLGISRVVPNTQPTRQTVLETLEGLTGQIMQKPPAFSAIKVGGKRAYDLARAGKVVDIPERAVTIYELELLNYNWPLVKIRAHVSSGTYIRTLAEDIGKALGTGAYCKELRRTSIADWNVADAVSVEDWKCSLL
ncbi:tRNA pseudouridine(55) synthase TruB [Candidatus Saccharibacteria bacterium]|nr:tRNA pseudouridine(55) synthase TruB [Candidatus Saccharibacteria bacterium]NCU40459.1 tRNA pseudouridine(55) synthase TruB [Candidatus Saccharibacteria bacterium]